MTDDGTTPCPLGCGARYSARALIQQFIRRREAGVALRWICPKCEGPVAVCGACETPVDTALAMDHWACPECGAHPDDMTMDVDRREVEEVPA